MAVTSSVPVEANLAKQFLVSGTIQGTQSIGLQDLGLNFGRIIFVQPVPPAADATDAANLQSLGYAIASDGKSVELRGWEQDGTANEIETAFSCLVWVQVETPTI